MSQDYYIGLSRKQIILLLRGETVGKRPYYNDIKCPDTKRKYDGTVRIHIKMLTAEERAKEPDTAFWQSY